MTSAEVQDIKAGLASSMFVGSESSSRVPDATRALHDHAACCPRDKRDADISWIYQAAKTRQMAS